MKSRLNKTNIEKLLRAKLQCSYNYFKIGAYSDMYATYREAWGMYEVLSTFCSPHCFSFYYHTFRSTVMEQNDWEEYRQTIWDMSKLHTNEFYEEGLKA